jgi:chromosome segregation ATPase
MHPDTIIAALREEYDKLPAQETERRAQIKAQIEYTDGLPRPIAKPGDTTTVADTTRVYYDALKQELANAPQGRHDEIQDEIDRVEANLPTARDEEDETVNSVEPSPEEIEQRKQTRAGRKGRVERARSAPVPDNPAPADTASDDAEE